MHRSHSTEAVLSKNAIFFDREVTERFHGHSARSPPFSVHANNEHRGSGEVVSQPRCFSGSHGSSSGGTEMAVSQFEALEMGILYEPPSGVECNNNIGREQKGLGSSLLGSDHVGSMVTSEEGPAYQCSGVESSSSCCLSFHPDVAGLQDPHSYGQHGGCLTDFEDGVDQVIMVSGGYTGNLGVCIVSQKQNYCTISPREIKHFGRSSE